MSRRLRATALAGVLTLAISGCGGVGGGGDSGGGATKGGGALSTMGFGLSDEIAKTRVDAFKKDHPDVQLTITEGAFDEQQFLTAVAAGTPPDAVVIGRDLLSTYAARGALMPLTDCIADMEIDMSQFRPQAVADSLCDAGNNAVIQIGFLVFDVGQYGSGNLHDACVRSACKGARGVCRVIEQNTLRDQRAVGQGRQECLVAVQPANDFHFSADDNPEPLAGCRFVKQAGAPLIVD